MLLAKEIYDGYPRSLEEDLKELQREDLTFNERNCLLYTSGEKQILQFLIRSCQKMIPLFDMDFKTARKIVEKDAELDTCKDYISNCVFYLIKKGL